MILKLLARPCLSRDDDDVACAAAGAVVVAAGAVE